MDETLNPALTAEQTAPAGPSLVTVADICFKPGGKVYFFDPGKFTLRAGDHVIISTARGNEFGYVSMGNHVVPKSELVAELRPVIRLATETDEQIAASNRDLEKQALTVCQQRVEALGLEMQLVSAEVAFDGSKIIFFFTADGRVDFRELVKNLASVFRTRIELRQIGVRDKAKMVGGLGICGRPFCCGEFLNEFQPVSIKMAKTQNLSLNPTKISGTCGRLMCCLKYEQEAYEDLLKTCPKNDSFVDTPEGRGTITEVNLLRESVKVRMEKATDEVKTFRNDEIYVLRSGKAKKTDPPIPDDLAPLSGGKPAERRPSRLVESVSMEEAMPEVRLYGESIGSTIGETAPEEPAQEPKEKSKNTSRRRRGGRNHRSGTSKQEPKPAEQQPAAPKAPKQEPKQPAKPRQSAKAAFSEGVPEKKQDGDKPAASHKPRRHRGGRGRRGKGGGAPKAPSAE